MAATEESNAYAGADDWTLEGRKALSSSIQQHAANLKGDSDLDLTDDEDEIHPMGGGATVVTSGAAESVIPPPSSPGKPPLTSPKKKKKRGGLVSALRGKRKYGKKDDASRVSFSGTTKTSFSTNAQKRSSTKVRAVIALFCLVVSLILALLFGHGSTGLWLTNHLIGVTPGTTSTKEPPMVMGIPGPLGTSKAYNSSAEAIPNLEAMNILLSPQIENLADWRIPFPASNRTDLPLFWHVPKAGGSAVQRILSQCLGLVEASGQGKGHSEPALQIFETAAGTRYVNVDPTTIDGIRRTHNLRLAQSGLADVLFTPLIIPITDIFDPVYRGRMFGVFRHPIERSMSVYNSAVQSDASIADMSLAEFAATRLPNNEMVRLLCNKPPNADLSDNDLYLAMEVLRRKCVVGLVDRMEESLVRFQGYFGWTNLMAEGVSKCQREFLAPSSAAMGVPVEGSEAYNFIMAQNRLDNRLYDFVLHLFDIQGGNAREIPVTIN